nr:ATP-binding protein [Nannocystis pusilla]
MQAGHTTHRVRVVVQDGLVAVADAGLVRLLLQNLLGNAFKFTRPSAEPTVEVSAEVSPAGELVYRVRDNGVGFDASRSEELFGPFCRLHGAGEFPGDGIGLATVQRIVRRHRGRIWAESAPGSGAAFFWTLSPASVDPVPQDIRRDSDARPHGGAEPALVGAQ